jgi:hypothetical protein
MNACAGCEFSGGDQMASNRLIKFQYERVMQRGEQRHELRTSERSLFRSGAGFAWKSELIAGREFGHVTHHAISFFCVNACVF